MAETHLTRTQWNEILEALRQKSNEMCELAKKLEDVVWVDHIFKYKVPGTYTVHDGDPVPKCEAKAATRLSGMCMETNTLLARMCDFASGETDTLAEYQETKEDADGKNRRK